MKLEVADPAKEAVPLRNRPHLASLVVSRNLSWLITVPPCFVAEEPRLCAGLLRRG